MTPVDIETTNQLFIRITQLGMCDENERGVFVRKWNGDGLKIVAKPNKPLLTMLLPLISSAMELAKYETVEQLREDTAALLQYAQAAHENAMKTKIEVVP